MTALPATLIAFLDIRLKAVSDLVDKHRTQAHNHLKATGCRLGLLINFGTHPKLNYGRIVR